MISHVTDHLLAHRPGHPLRVAVDGITAAGKTTFARTLAATIEGRGRPAIHLSMDGFHHPRAHRHRQGRDSAVGYYEDAYDFPSFATMVLDPLGPGGDRRYRSRIIDLATDTAIDEPPVLAATDTILVVDGSFLQRPELAGRWDETVYLDVSFAVARERGAHRDADQFGGATQAAQAFDNRYHAACRRYLAAIDPAAHATVVVANDDPSQPVLRRIGDQNTPLGWRSRPMTARSAPGGRADGASTAPPWPPRTVQPRPTGCSPSS